MTSSDEHFIVASGLVKIFKVAGLEVVALQGLDLEVRRGEMLALVGPSGSGKSTLLSALGGLDRPSAGQLVVNGRDLVELSHQQLTAYRRAEVGLLWQQTARNLLPYLSARANVELLMSLCGSRRRARRAWIDELFEAVGMREHERQRPGQLSGGQQQRVAIACALANRPQMLLADEPTGEVDWDTARRILALLRELRERYGLTIVMVTHDPRVAEQADRVVAIRDGRTSTELVRSGETATSANSRAETSDRPYRAADELVVLDRAGRLQLPGEQRALAGIHRRARVELVEGGILIRPGDDAGTIGTAEAGAEADGYEGLYDAPAPPTAPQTSRRQRWWNKR